MRGLANEKPNTDISKGVFLEDRIANLWGFFMVNAVDALFDDLVQKGYLGEGSGLQEGLAGEIKEMYFRVMRRRLVMAGVDQVLVDDAVR